MKRLKHNKKVEIFVKICTVWCFVSSLIFCAVSLLQASNTVTIICFLLFVIPGIVLIIYPFIFQIIPEDFKFKTTPDVFSIDYSCFGNFSDSAAKALEHSELIEIYCKKYDDYEQHIYSQIYFDNKMFTQKDFVIIVNADETTEELISKAYVDFIRSTESFYGRRLKSIAWNLNIVFVFCTSHITQALEKLLHMDAGFAQSYSLGMFFSVISFDSKNVYLVKRKGLLGKTKYDRCRKKFLNYFSFLFPEQTDK